LKESTLIDKQIIIRFNDGIFAGALDISKVPTLRDRLMFRLSVLFGVWSEGDHRDWTAIRAWAESRVIDTRHLLPIDIENQPDFARQRGVFQGLAAAEVAYHIPAGSCGAALQLRPAKTEPDRRARIGRASLCSKGLYAC
jgi:hypothetical protein